MTVSGTTLNLIPQGGVFLADLVTALRETSRESFVASAPSPALLELPAGTFGPDVSDYAFDAPPERQEQGWAERLALLRQRVRPGDVKVYFLTSRARDEAGVVGSAEDVDVRLSASDAVDPRHAELFLRGSLWRVRDLESGTWVEGKRLPTGIPLPIVGGHRLRVGGAELLFLLPAQLHALATPPAARAPAPRGVAPPPRGVELKTLAAAAAAIEQELFTRRCPGPFLLQVPQVVDGASDAAHSGAHTRALTLEELLGLTRDRNAQAALVHGLTPGAPGGSVVVGRDAAACDVVLPEVAVSRRHAAFSAPKGQLALMDLESQNGTWLEDARLPAGVTRLVRPGQVIGFGPYRAVLLDASAMHDLAVRVASQSTERLRRPAPRNGATTREPRAGTSTQQGRRAPASAFARRAEAEPTQPMRRPPPT